MLAARRACRSAPGAHGGARAPPATHGGGVLVDASTLFRLSLAVLRARPPSLASFESRVVSSVLARPTLASRRRVPARASPVESGDPSPESRAADDMSNDFGNFNKVASAPPPSATASPSPTSWYPASRPSPRASSWRSPAARVSTPPTSPRSSRPSPSAHRPGRFRLRRRRPPHRQSHQRPSARRPRRDRMMGSRRSSRRRRRLRRRRPRREPHPHLPVGRHAGLARGAGSFSDPGDGCSCTSTFGATVRTRRRGTRRSTNRSAGGIRVGMQGRRGGGGVGRGRGPSRGGHRGDARQ